jgi:hypothetical protein
VHAVERAIDELIKTETRFCIEALSTPSDKTEFGYGHACGMFQALKMARSILERCMNEDDVKARRLELRREL